MKLSDKKLLSSILEKYSTFEVLSGISEILASKADVYSDNLLSDLAKKATLESHIIDQSINYFKRFIK